MTDEPADKKKKAKLVPINPKLWEQFNLAAGAELGEHKDSDIGIRKLTTLVQEYVGARLELTKFAKKKLPKKDTEKA